MPTDGTDWAHRRGPEWLLAGLAAVVFLGGLGSVELWGKREQRASAEAIDTIQNRHWLIAEIQGRPRLEKPPLPRWTIAALMTVLGRQDERVVRLPSALSALGMVWLTYALGRRIGGRSAGLASGLALCASAFFISEVRQAGNDGPLAFFTTLALYAAWRRLHDEGESRLGGRGWSVLMWVAMGLGFLCKGPVVLPLVALAVVPYLALSKRLREGMAALADWRGISAFVLLALSWPVPVLIADPTAARVWYMEMAQKAGTAGITHHRNRGVLAQEWPWMAAPWSVLGLLAIVSPLAARDRHERPGVWFPWCWALGNLLMFCCWKVAKPNYYLPCLPAVALLVGVEWVRLCRSARGEGRGSSAARWVLLSHAGVLLAAAVAGPFAAGWLAPEALGWASLASASVGLGVVAGIWAWRKGADAMAMAPVVGAAAVSVVVGYGAIAPAYNPARSHRELAAALGHLLPASTHTVMFHKELDEGLWFYLRDRILAPVPGTQPRYNDGFDIQEDFERGKYRTVEERIAHEKQVLLDWLHEPRAAEQYLLIRAKTLGVLGLNLDGLAEPVLVERDLRRNELMLLRVPRREVVAGRAEPILK